MNFGKAAERLDATEPAKAMTQEIKAMDHVDTANGSVVKFVIRKLCELAGSAPRSLDIACVCVCVCDRGVEIQIGKVPGM